MLCLVLLVVATVVVFGTVVYPGSIQDALVKYQLLPNLNMNSSDTELQNSTTTFYNTTEGIVWNTWNTTFAVSDTTENPDPDFKASSSENENDSTAIFKELMNTENTPTNTDDIFESKGLYNYKDTDFQSYR